MLTLLERARLERELAGLREVRSSDRDEVAAVERRMAQLERLVAESQVVDDGWFAAGCAAPGRAVTVRYAGTGRVRSYVLSGTAGDARTVSVGSPVGQALVGRRVGEVVAVTLPDGKREQLQIMSVAPMEAAA